MKCEEEEIESYRNISRNEKQTAAKLASAERRK
jgi:hypothetical protein